MIWKERLKKFGIVYLATGSYFGFFPIASGTAGTVVGVAIVWAYRDFPLWSQLLLCLALGAVGVWVSGQAERIFRKSDSSYIVIDEIVGFMITMIGIPITPYWLICGFILFRFLDVVKLPPADYFDERVKNGWGVMLDDVFAGIYGNIWLHLMLRTAL